MHKKFFNAMYVFNVVLQAFFSLLTPVALGFGIAWLLVNKLSVGEWVYVVMIIIGVGSGLLGMVRFVLSSMAGIERLEREWEIEEKKRLAQIKKRKVDGSGEEKQ